MSEPKITILFITDAQTSKPLAGVRVTVQEPNGHTVCYGLTGSDGHVYLMDVPVPMTLHVEKRMTQGRITIGEQPWA